MARGLLDCRSVADLYDDIRSALRALTRSPVVAFILIGSLAVGTGANATVFSLINALLFRAPPGVGDTSTLVAVYTSQFDGAPYGSSSYPDFESIAADRQTFSALAAIDDHTLATWQVGDASEHVRVAAVTPGFFDALAMKPVLGQLSLGNPAADTPDAVISHRLWQQSLGADGSALGQAVTIDDRHYRLAGVAPDRFNGLQLGRVVEI